MNIPVEGDGAEKTSNFIRHKIDGDLDSGRVESVVTRFPPEPNGYLHIGHAKSICLNFGLAEDYEGICNLRLDDTNPLKENTEYVESILEDVRWLGFDPKERVFFASDYFEQLFAYALQLIDKGLAYVDSQDAEQIREGRGTLTEPGVDSPDRNRSIEENKALFLEMREGKHPDGSLVLRAKIDMAHPNMNMRDPTIYRIRRATHHRTGDAWCIYPMYDFAHGLSDAIEGVTHSLCTLEFADHRVLYDWFLDALEIDAPRPEQTEFARLNLEGTALSKRLLIRLVEEGIVDGWDDPRMPTISGLRRLGVPPEALRDFCDRIGVAKAASLVDRKMLNFSIRQALNLTAQRRMAILDPLKLTITNLAEGESIELQADNNPEDEQAGTRSLQFTRNLWIEQGDFIETAPNKKWRRLAVGKEVRLLHAFYVTCTGVVRNDAGEIVEVLAEYDPATKGGWSDDGRKVKGTIHWLSDETKKTAQVRRYESLYTLEDVAAVPEGKDLLDFVNPDSKTIQEIWVEPSVCELEAGTAIQMVRDGYYVVDRESSSDQCVLNYTVGLRDSFKAG